MLPFDVGEIAGDAPGDAGGGVRGSGACWSEEKAGFRALRCMGPFLLLTAVNKSLAKGPAKAKAMPGVAVELKSYSCTVGRH